MEGMELPGPTRLGCCSRGYKLSLLCSVQTDPLGQCSLSVGCGAGSEGCQAPHRAGAMSPHTPHPSKASYRSEGWTWVF